MVAIKTMVKCRIEREVFGEGEICIRKLGLPNEVKKVERLMEELDGKRKNKF